MLGGSGRQCSLEATESRRRGVPAAASPFRSRARTDSQEARNTRRSKTVIKKGKKNV